MFKWNEQHGYKYNEKVKENPYHYDNIAKIKESFAVMPEETKKAHPDIFYYFDGLCNVKVSQSVHPAGMVISPITLADEYGVFNKDGELCLTLDMDNAHLAGLIKYDMLILKSVKVVRDACNYMDIPYPKTCEIDFNDQEVWKDIGRDQSMIFQFESKFASDCMKKFKPKSIFDMSLVTACIRPSGMSYREDLLSHKIHKNATEDIDNLLKDNYGLDDSPFVQKCA